MKNKIKEAPQKNHSNLWLYIIATNIITFLIDYYWSGFYWLIVAIPATIYLMYWGGARNCYWRAAIVKLCFYMMVVVSSSKNYRPAAYIGAAIGRMLCPVLSGDAK